MLLQGPRDQRLQLVPPRSHREDPSVAAYQDRLRDPMNFVMVRELTAVGNIDTRPGNIAASGELGDGVIRTVEADADHLESLGSIRRVSPDDVGDLRHAGAAPSGPEIDQDHLS